MHLSEILLILQAHVPVVKMDYAEPDSPCKEESMKEKIQKMLCFFQNFLPQTEIFFFFFKNKLLMVTC